MKTQFHDIEDLKTSRSVSWSNQLFQTVDRLFGNVFFLVNGRKYRVHFDCVLGTYYEAKFYYYGSRSSINARIANSFRGLLDKVYDLLSNN